LPGKRGSDLLPFACASVDAVVFITGHQTFNSAVAYKKDANIVIRKPIKPKDFVNAVIRYVNVNFENSSNRRSNGRFRNWPRSGHFFANGF
jgi:hypothetical protein